MSAQTCGDRSADSGGSEPIGSFSIPLVRDGHKVVPDKAEGRFRRTVLALLEDRTGSRM